jgi:hypothetical protein
MEVHTLISYQKLISSQNNMIYLKIKCKNFKILTLPNHIIVLKEKELQLLHRFKLLKLNYKDIHLWLLVIILIILYL